MKALVTGGTGTLGRLVVPRLQDAGYDVRVLSRYIHDGLEGFEFVAGDLATGGGIDAAVEGTEIIVHLAGDKKGDEHKAQNLVRAASRNGTQHLAYISVVGADRIPVTSRIDRTMFGYFASKLAAEQVVGRFRLAVDNAARHASPSVDVAAGAAVGQAACDTGSGSGGGSSPSMLLRWRTGLSNLHWLRRPDWCSTSPARACTR